VADLTESSNDRTLAAERHPAPRDAKSERDKARDAIKEVRATDLEPYTGLRYLSKLFRFMAVILIVLLIAEVATGVYTQGSASVPTLLGEASRLIVLAGVLWGTGDLAHLLIDVGHDVRAARILVARVAHAASPSTRRSARAAKRASPTGRCRVATSSTVTQLERATPGHRFRDPESASARRLPSSHTDYGPTVASGRIVAAYRPNFGELDSC